MDDSDLSVQKKSDALDGVKIDLIVSGSIAAVESVRFIRCLRRLGADVYPFLTEGGRLFATEMSLEWASSNKVVSSFDGTASHLSTHDVCIVAPASANFMSHVCNGLTGSPSTALVSSYLGMSRPVFFVPNMHDSLMHSPIFQENLAKLTQHATLLSARLEEGKNKFPIPEVLADQIAHIINAQLSQSRPPVLITMGTTRGYVDDIRYFSNYSSGKLGSLIAEELYRQGYPTHVVSGPAQVTPRTASKISHIETNSEMLLECKKAMDNDCKSAIFAASVLDFIPTHKFSGKIKSTDELHVNFEKSEKIIAQVNPRGGVKIGFKLETALTENEMSTIAQEYITKYNLNLLVFNLRQDITSSKHLATIFEHLPPGDLICHKGFEDKETIARFIAGHIKKSEPILS